MNAASRTTKTVGTNMKRLILHLGHPKTASTYLQSVMHLNEEAFLKRGFWIPSDFEAFGSYNFQSLAATGQIFSGNLQSLFEAAMNHDSEQVGRLMDYALRTDEENVILSSELLFYYNWVVQEIVQRANDHNFRVEILVYLARQDRAVVTGYQQSVRNHGAHGSVVHFLEEHRKQLLFEYAAVIDSYGITSPNRVIVRTFDPKFLQNGKICADFLNLLQCPIDPASLHYPSRDLNTRLPLEWCEMLRACNAADDTARMEWLRCATPALDPSSRQRSDAYYFREDVRDYVLTHYMADNRDLIATYLHDRPLAERQYWTNMAPARGGVLLDPRSLADCLAYLHKMPAARASFTEPLRLVHSIA